MQYSKEELKKLPSLSRSQCCDLKIADGSMRVWLCRVGGGISIEKLVNDRWRRVEGGCLI